RILLGVGPDCICGAYSGMTFSNRHLALSYYWSMIFSEIRYPLQPGTAAASTWCSSRTAGRRDSFHFCLALHESLPTAIAGGGQVAEPDVAARLPERRRVGDAGRME